MAQLAAGREPARQCLPSVQVARLSWPFNFLSFFKREEKERDFLKPSYFFSRRKSKRRPLSRRKKEIKQQRK